MTKFLINIWAYQYHSRFEIESNDNAKDVENAIVDKLGENSIKWEYLGETYDPRTNRITFEEVVDDTRPIQSKKVLGVEVGTRASI
jgi:Zn-dependent membrane protease YugP